LSFTAFHDLTVTALRTLAASLRDGALSRGLLERTLQQIVGTRAESVRSALEGLYQQGLTPAQAALLISAIIETRERIPDPSLVFEVVLSGPALERVPTQHTSAVVHTLFCEATTEVIVAGYAIHNGKDIFAPLHARMIAHPDLDVRLLFDVARRDNAKDPDQIIADFRTDFNARHWPWSERPAVYFYPRSLDDVPANRGSLHAKCVIVDGRAALITSANFTEAAQQRNLETGILTRYEPMIQRLRNYFLGLIHEGHMRQIELD